MQVRSFCQNRLAHLHGLSLDFAVLSAERELFEQEVEARDYRLSVSLQSAVCSLQSAVCSLQSAVSVNCDKRL